MTILCTKKFFVVVAENKTHTNVLAKRKQGNFVVISLFWFEYSNLLFWIIIKVPYESEDFTSTLQKLWEKFSQFQCDVREVRNRNLCILFFAKKIFKQIMRKMPVNNILLTRFLTWNLR